MVRFPAIDLIFDLTLPISPPPCFFSRKLPSATGPRAAYLPSLVRLLAASCAAPTAEFPASPMAVARVAWLLAPLNALAPGVIRDATTNVIASATVASAGRRLRLEQHVPLLLERASHGCCCLLVRGRQEVAWLRLIVCSPAHSEARSMSRESLASPKKGLSGSQRHTGCDSRVVGLLNFVLSGLSPVTVPSLQRGKKKGG